MDEFFAVWKAAKDIYGLERKAHIDFEEVYIRIYLDGEVIVRADGIPEELDYVYSQAAQRLAAWVRGKNEQIGMCDMRQEV